MSQILKRLVLVCAIWLLSGVMWASAQGPGLLTPFIQQITDSCKAVSFVIQVDGFADHVVRLLDMTNDVVLGVENFTTDVSSGILTPISGTFNFTPLPPGTLIQLQVESTFYIWTETAASSIFGVLSCPDDPDDPHTPTTSAPPVDDRFCFAPGEARVAIYTDFTADDPGISIWRINDQNAGVRVIDVTASELRRFGNVRVNTLVSEDLFSAVKLYKLTNGWYQINAGPYGERKIHACLFNSIPPTQIFKFTIEY